MAGAHARRLERRVSRRTAPRRPAPPWWSTPARMPRAEGDVITIAGVFRVHPETKVSTGVLQQFVIGAGATTARRSRSRRRSSPRARRRTSPARRPTTPRSPSWAPRRRRYRTSLLYQKDAFAFATADLVMPQGVDFASREVLDGVSDAHRAPVRHQQRQVPVPSRRPLRLQDDPAAVGRALAQQLRMRGEGPSGPSTVLQFRRLRQRPICRCAGEPRADERVRDQPPGRLPAAHRHQARPRVRHPPARCGPAR